MKSIIKNQNGMASIMFAMFFVIVISLITIGFATLVRNDQRQTIDRTLSNQALYAAETGVNRVQRYVQSNPDSINDNCSSTINNSPKPSDPLDPNNPALKITCLKWNASPNVLSDGALGINPVSWPMEPFDSSQNIQSIKIVWAPSGNTPKSFDPNSGTANLRLLDNNFPTLRVVLAPVSNINNPVVMFINPASSGPNVNAVDGAIVNSSCSDTTDVVNRSCTIIISNLPGPVGGWSNGAGRGYLAISALNGTANLKALTGYASPQAGGNQVNFRGAQVEIDSTAVAQDVIKRIKVNVSTDPAGWKPGFSILADNLCKNYKLDGTSNSEEVDGGPKCPDLTP